MRKFHKSFDSLVAYFRRLEDSGVFEVGQSEDIEKAVAVLRHDLEVGDIKRIRAAVDALARVFLRRDR